jgi:hypothetical protein
MEISIKIPTGLDEISLGQYQKFLKIQEENEDKNFIAQKMVEIFCNIPLDQVVRLRYSDVQKITEIMTKMLDAKPSMTEMFKLKGVEYGFIPNLDQISFGEFVDLDSYLQDWTKMHLAMNVMYRPVDIQAKGRYNIKEYKPGDADHLKDMPLGIALASIFFLLNLGKELSQVMMDYLDQGKIKEVDQVKEALQKNGVGINHFTSSLRGILQDLNISLK